MVDDGYGAVYRIIDHKVVCTLTSWNYSTVTNIDRFQENMSLALSDVYDMYENLAAATCSSL